MYGIDGNKLCYDEIQEEKEKINEFIKQILTEVLTPYQNPIELAAFNFDEAVAMYRCMMHGALVFFITGGLTQNKDELCLLIQKTLTLLTQSWIHQK